ncbi:MAG: PilN domain-containing protein [Nostocaceae cyanobacterium]|nr:PilN domain-containing protein [Nostocaceae cyanobacterium]
MYSLDINFLKERPGYVKNSKNKTSFSLPAGDLTLVYIGLAVGLCFPALVGGAWWFLQAKNTELEQQIAQLDQENKKLETKIGNINKIKKQTKGIKSETEALVSVFDQIRPWSAMLEDLRVRIPATVQIENIKQIPPLPPKEGKPAPNPAGGVEISGLARSFNDVNDFLLTLQQSSFLKATETKIMTAELVDAPIPQTNVPQGVTIKPPQIVRYTIQSNMSDIPASELMRELEQKGTLGLVSRIRSLQQKGVIKK